VLNLFIALLLNSFSNEEKDGNPEGETRKTKVQLALDRFSRAFYFMARALQNFCCKRCRRQNSPKPNEATESFAGESRDTATLDTRSWKEYDSEMTLYTGQAGAPLAPLAKEEDDMECCGECDASPTSQPSEEAQVWKVRTSHEMQVECTVTTGHLAPAVFYVLLRDMHL
jgi:voltage-gated sodium channel type XI alpha